MCCFDEAAGSIDEEEIGALRCFGGDSANKVIIVPQAAKNRPREQQTDQRQTQFTG